MNVGKIENLYDSDNSIYWRRRCGELMLEVAELELQIGQLNAIVSAVGKESQTDKKPCTCE